MAENKLDPQDQCSVFECDHRHQDCLLACKAIPLVAEGSPHAPRHRWTVGYMRKCILPMTYVYILLILDWLPPKAQILAYFLSGISCMIMNIVLCVLWIVEVYMWIFSGNSHTRPLSTSSSSIRQEAKTPTVSPCREEQPLCIKYAECMHYHWDCPWGSPTFPLPVT